MAYWMGKPTILLPKVIRDYLSEKITVIEVGDDVSVITQPSQRFCFYFSESYDNDTTLLTLLKICQNLSKTLVLFHDSSIPEAYLKSGLVKAHVDITSPHALKKTALAFEHVTSLLEKNGDTQPTVSSVSETQIRKEVNQQQTRPELNTIDAALDYIEKHYNENLREVDVAAHCHLSTQHFSRVFHKKVGRSFRDHVSQLRLEHAKRLLLANEVKQISAIAYQSGFKDVSYFSRFFKKKTGMSPGTFRNFKGILKIS
ncbi:AraC family transcriptional regulator [Vibrio wakamikoensis]|jgi:YesN/AraC family two-component response regulator|uniref:AraC family transcriptional regulator n=1 Tax=Vibrio TaxID=662 RepID=UPI003AB6EEC8